MTYFIEKFQHGWAQCTYFIKKILHLRKYNSCPHRKCFSIGEEIVDKDLMQDRGVIYMSQMGRKILGIGPYDHERDVNVNTDKLVLFSPVYN